jgi:hypothetical protein
MSQGFPNLPHCDNAPASNFLIGKKIHALVLRADVVNHAKAQR